MNEGLAQAKRGVRELAKVAGVVVLASFLFGFAMVPLYRIACEHVLGIKLAGEVVAPEKVAAMEVDSSRKVTVEFVAGVNSRLPWAFAPELSRIEVHPGALTEVWFDATNHSGDAIVGNAVPSVAPGSASLYFNKTECFCFTEQKLDAGESRRMPVRFVVDPRLPDDVRTLTLSYTFYENETATRRLAARAIPSPGSLSGFGDPGEDSPAGGRIFDDSPADSGSIGQEAAEMRTPSGGFAARSSKARQAPSLARH